MPTLDENAPMVSVLMGVLYRRETLFLLERAVSSILNQTYQNLELLICDDGSVEAALRYLEEAADRDRRVRLIRGCPREDLAGKLNWCMAEAKGAYIARMDDDDFSFPERIAKQIAILLEKSEISFVGCNVNIFCHGYMTGQRILPEYPDVRSFLFVQPFIHPTLLFRKEALLAVQGYSEDQYCELCEDYDLLLRMYAKGYRGMNMQECLLNYSISERAHGSRRMTHRWNEAVTRYRRFRELKLLPRACPYVIKPLVVGILPNSILSKIKCWLYRWYS